MYADVGSRKKGNDIMDAKTYLGQLQMIDTLIDQKLLELDELKESVRGTKGMEYSADRVQTSPQNSQETIICKYLDLDAEINRDIDHFVDSKHQVIKQIQGLDDIRYVKLLFKIYVEYKTIMQTAEEMQMSYGYVRRLHMQALNTFEQKYKNLEKFC